MAPERFRGISDRRGDLCALGATLYELLTLHHAFEGKDQLELIHRIENDPPVPPRQLEVSIPRDLETIVLKALAKEPANRFGSAEELAAELRRFIDDRPIHSRPIAYYQQFWRWCKRNPGLATANITAAALTTILAVVSTVAALSYRRQRDQITRQRNDISTSLVLIQKSETTALQARAEAREQLFVALLDRARAGRFSRRMGQRFDGLDALSKAAEIGPGAEARAERLDTAR